MNMQLLILNTAAMVKTESQTLGTPRIHISTRTMGRPDDSASIIDEWAQGWSRRVQVEAVRSSAGSPFPCPSLTTATQGLAE
jgi:hypothetical protein